MYSYLLQVQFSFKDHNYKFAKKTFINPSSKFELSKNAKVQLGNKVNIDSNCLIKVFKNAKLTIEDNVYIGPHTHVYITGDMTIGEGSIFGPFCFLIDHDHDFDLKSKLKLEEMTVNKEDQINIGKHTWLGTRSTVMKGVTIGDYSVIGAGSIVTKNIAAHSLAVGVPAKVVKTAT